MKSRLVIDARYVGRHGIARYAQEVVSRIHLDWEPLPGKYRPGSPIDVFDRHRAALSPQTLLYNPGYTAGISRCLQLVTIHDLIHLTHSTGPKAAAKRAYYERVVRPVVMRSQNVLTVSEASRNRIIAWLSDDRIEVHNAGNGCSDVFARTGEVADLGAPYFLYVGNLKAHKNAMIAFEAMARLPDFRFVVVCGDTQEARAWAESLGISKRTDVKTRVSDCELATLYRGAEALVLPSLVEGFGLPAAEALQCGTRVVHLRACETVAEICEQENGVESATDAEEWAHAMEQAASQPRVNGRARFKWDDVAFRVESVIERMRHA